MVGNAKKCRLYSTFPYVVCYKRVYYEKVCYERGLFRMVYYE